MRICYVCPDLGVPVDGTKGASAHVRGLVRAFKTLGHELTIVAGTADSDAGLGVPVVTIPRPLTLRGGHAEENPRVARALGHLWNNVELEHLLLDVLNRFKPHLVYERYSPFGAATGQVACQQGIPHVMEVNALLAEEGKRYRNQAMGDACEFLEGVALRTPGLLVAVSEPLREALVEKGVDPARTMTVPNGVDTAMFSAEGPRMEVAPAGSVVLGFVGSLKPWHGLDRLADAFRALAEDPAYHLLVVGDGPERKQLRQLEKEMPGRVTLTRNVSHDDVPAYLRAMDITLAPYPELEQFYFSPLKILEYMACGRAVVASSIGQVDELVQQGTTGLLVPPDEPKALVEAIRLLRHDPALRKKMGDAAARHVADQHDWVMRALHILGRAGCAGLLTEEKPESVEYV